MGLYLPTQQANLSYFNAMSKKSYNGEIRDNLSLPLRSHLISSKTPTLLLESALAKLSVFTVTQVDERCQTVQSK